MPTRRDTAWPISCLPHRGFSRIGQPAAVPVALEGERMSPCRRMPAVGLSRHCSILISFVLLLFLLDHGLRSSQPGNRHAEWRRAHVAHPHPMAILHALRVAAVLSAD